MHFRRTLVAFAATAVAVAAPAAAHAASLSSAVHSEIVGSHGETAAFQDMTFRAAPGERNDVTVRMEPGAVVVTDAGGAPLTAGAGCVAQDAVTARCALVAMASASIDVDAGDGDDRITVGPAPSGVAWIATTLHGGAGNDVLDAGGKDSAGAAFDGGPGDDVELGSAVSDSFEGDPGHDVISGGGGDDSLSYARRSDPVRASIGVQEPGDEDAVSGVESLSGGHGDDHLTGSDGDDDIDGGPGADAIDGRGGDDHLSAGGDDVTREGRRRPRRRRERRDPAGRRGRRRRRPWP